MSILDGVGFTVDINGNRNIQAEIRKYQNGVLDAVRDGLESAVIEIIERLKVNMSMYGITSLQDNIGATYGDDYVRIEVISLDENGNNIAEYIEFGTGIRGTGIRGTGIRGSENPHPEPKIGWKYDSKNHGEDGWFYISDRDGKLHWTAGTHAKPFMYETALWAKKRGVIARHVNPKVRAVFK